MLIGGEFEIAGTARVSKLAFWNGSKWTAVNNSLQGTVTRLCVRQGVPYAVVQSEGTPTQAALFRLDSAWTQVLTLNGQQSLYPSDVDEMIVVGSTIYIAGTFESVTIFSNGSSTGQTTIASKGVIRSTATGWEALPAMSAPATTMAVAALPSGVAVYRDGQRFRVFDGSSSYYLGGSNSYWGAHEALFAWRNEVYILGPDPIPNTSSSKPTLYRWLGTSADYPLCFERLDVPFTGTEFASVGVAVFPDSLAVFGNTSGYRWRDGIATTFTFASIGTRTFCGNVGGRAVVAGASASIGIGGYGIASWDPAALEWGVFGTGFNGPITAMTTYKGNLCVAGSFTRAGSVAARGIAIRRNGAWEPLGPGIDGSVAVMHELDGSLFVSGDFVVADGAMQTFRYAQWDGTKWLPIPVFSGHQAAFDLERIGNRLFVTFPYFTHGEIRTWSFHWGSSVLGVGGSDYETVTTAPMPSANSVIWLGKQLPNGTAQAFVFDGFRVTPSPWTVAVAPPLAFARLSRVGPWVMELRSGSIWDGTSAWAKITPYPSPGAQGSNVRAAAYFDDSIVFAGRWPSLQGSTTLLRRRVDGAVTTLGAPPTGTIFAMHVDGDSLLVSGSFLHSPNVVSPFLMRYGPVPERAVQITLNPVPIRNCGSRSSNFAVGVSGAGPIFYQWRRNGVPLKDGVTPTGSRVSGSAGGGLTIGPATRGRVSVHDEGVIDCVITNVCGSVITTPVEFKVLGGDFNCNLQVNDADFATFAAAYDAVVCPTSGVAASCLADLNVDGVVDDADFEIFAIQYDNY